MLNYIIYPKTTISSKSVASHKCAIIGASALKYITYDLLQQLRQHSTYSRSGSNKYTPTQHTSLTLSPKVQITDTHHIILKQINNHSILLNRYTYQSFYLISQLTTSVQHSFQSTTSNNCHFISPLHQ